jgi:hypothetical protein
MCGPPRCNQGAAAAATCTSITPYSRPIRSTPCLRDEKGQATASRMSKREPRPSRCGSFSAQSAGAVLTTGLLRKRCGEAHPSQSSRLLSVPLISLGVCVHCHDDLYFALLRHTESPVSVSQRLRARVIISLNLRNRNDLYAVPVQGPSCKVRMLIITGLLRSTKAPAIPPADLQSGSDLGSRSRQGDQGHRSQVE